MPLPLRTSAVPEKDEFYSRLVERCITVVIDTLGNRDVRALLMIGAPARSEVTVVETPDGFYSLSDIDLVCACSYGTDAEALRAKLAPAMAKLNEELGSVCAGGADVSMKSEVQLAEPHPLISTYEMVRSPVVVWGDERIVSALGDVDIADVPNTESLTLMHNRITEALLVRPGNGAAETRTDALQRLYATAKLTLDSITAFLFLRNNVPTGFADRVDYFLDDVLRRPESAGLRDRLSEYLDELPAWALFKTTGDLTGVAGRLGGSLDDDGIGALADRAWLRCVEYSEVFWRAILSDVVRRDATSRDLAHIARLYRKLESPLRSAFRARMMLKRAPEGLFSTLGTYKRARFASPRVLAYLTAVIIYMSYGERMDWERAEKLARKHCPFDMPKGYSDLSSDRRRESLIGILELFHHDVLLGRKTK